MTNINKRSTIMRHAIINQLGRVNGASSYLEIGVARGMTFRKVNVNHRCGVDPEFRFDFHALEDDKTSFYQLSSDEFFSGLDSSKKFDLIFIDGLHTFEQTLRDFNNAMCHAHDQTIIIIDDVCPKSVYAAHRLQREAAIFRRMDGLDDPSWMGDVYKVIFFLHDFYPQFTYATMLENHGQTVVWKKKRESFRPMFSGVEEISRSGYLDYLRVKDRVMKFLPFEKILFEVSAELMK